MASPSSRPPSRLSATASHETMKTSNSSKLKSYPVPVIDESSSFDKVLSRLEKTIERVNENAGDSANKLKPSEARLDSTDKRDSATERREKLEALARKVMKPQQRNGKPAKPVHKPIKKLPRVRGTDFEVELVLSMSAQLETDAKGKVNPSKKAANDIIWRAYANTRSFGAIINGVIATQAVARRWLTVKKVKDDMDRKVAGVSRVKALWRGYRVRMFYCNYVKNVILCQTVARRHLAIEKVEREKHEIAYARAIEKRDREFKMATIITSAYRGYSVQKHSKQSVKDIIMVQSLVRRYAAKKQAQIMRHQRDTAASLIIQAKWRSVYATMQYKATISKAISLQCMVRQLIANKVLEQLKEERYALECEMTTKIATEWRRHHCQMLFKRTVCSIIICQSVVRRFAAIKVLNSLKFKRDTAAATVIVTEVRCFMAKRQYRKLKCSTIYLQSIVRQGIAQMELARLQEERRELEEQEATRIAAVWRSYYVRTGYVIVLKAARRHELRYTAASIIQAEWRCCSARRTFVINKVQIIRIQSVVRKIASMENLKAKKTKLEEAANYHSQDYFAYSKKRKVAATKIQATYRMHPHRRTYTDVQKELNRVKAEYMKEQDELDAANKIQSTYRKRYSARMNRATSNTDLTSSAVNQNPNPPIFDDAVEKTNIEVELGERCQSPTQLIHVNDCFSSAKKRRAASTSIQATFRGYLGRRSAKRTAYLAKHAFEMSKKRRAAAEKIQSAYRKHLFRTTCYFRPQQSFDKCTDLVPYVTPADKSSTGFEIVTAASTDLLAIIMSMITGS